MKLKVIILSETPPRAATLCWRKLGERRFAQVPLKPVARGVYSVQLPAGGKDDFEYYVQVETEGRRAGLFPGHGPEAQPDSGEVCGRVTLSPFGLQFAGFGE